jgi:glycosyltransferase involved in cell wall biosynthesis
MTGFASFAVIIPSFNQGVYLRELLESLIRQNYPYIQIIIIDGGSTDGTLQVIREFDDHLFYWESCADDGQVHAINRGLSLATADWVCWQNADDLFADERAFLIYNKYIQQFPSADLFFADINLINSFSRILRPIRYSPLCFTQLSTEGMQISNQSSFWRRKLHSRHGFLNEKYSYCFDYDWFLQLAKVSANTVHIPQILGSFRVHNCSKTSLSSQHFSMEMRLICSDRGIYSPRYIKLFLNIYYKAIRAIYYILTGHPFYLIVALKGEHRIVH